MSAKMIVLIGLPACGKSTWADVFVKIPSNNAVIVSRDAIRLGNFGVVFEPRIENDVTLLSNTLILEALRMGKTVVVDNTNLRDRYRNDLKKLCLQSGVDVEYQEKFFFTDVLTCLERNKARLVKRVPDEAMSKFVASAEAFYSGKKIPKDLFFLNSPCSSMEQDTYLVPAIICDLDGTLCLLNGRDPYDASTCDRDLVNTPVLECLTAMHAQGYKVLFVSGREDKYQYQTSRWLHGNWAREFDLFMRAEGDTREDSIIKNEIFDREIRNKYYVEFVLDDRPRVVRMWRRLGLTVFQLNDREF